jgi:anti-sigma regulatory factor (Ser/Thr protein kinase)
MIKPFSYKIAGYPTSLQGCLRELEESAVYQAMPVPLRFVAELILDELASNTLKYGGPDFKELSCEVAWDGHQMRVTLCDDAAPFNPWTDAPKVDDDPADDLDELQIGGRGIHMLLQATDSRHYERRAGKNCHILTRSLRPSHDCIAA